MKFWLPLVFVVLSCCTVFSPNVDTKLVPTAYVGRLIMRNQGETKGYGSCVPILCVPASEGYEIYMLTAKHCVEGVETFQVEFYTRGKGPNIYIYSEPISFTTQVTVVKVYENNDVALIKAITPHPVPTAKLAARMPPPYRKVLAVGCALGMPPVISEGVYTRFDREFQKGLVSAPVVPGNSGGGVFDAETGELIGITSAFALFSLNAFERQAALHIHWIVPVDIIRTFLINTIKTS